MAIGRGGKRDAEAALNLPPGFRFHPTDEELVVHYLCRRVAKQCLPVPIIAEVDLYKFNPWELPDKALFGHKEWYFFTPRDRKYPNGSRPNRAAGRGYWKATGADKPVMQGKGSTRPLGIKKALVFYHGKAPRGVKTDWIMHEYRLGGSDTPRPLLNNKGSSLRLDDWVLCRLYNKKNAWEKKTKTKEEESSPSSDIEQLSDPNVANAQPLKPIIIKEDNNDWFQGLNLDDLQGPFAAAFQPAVPTIDLSNQDFYFSNLGSPFPRSSQNGSILPF